MPDENKTVSNVVGTPLPVAPPTVMQPNTAISTPDAPIEQPLHEVPQQQAQNSPKHPFFGQPKLKKENVLELLFRFGFATVFLINAWAALAQPDSFLNLIQNNFAARFVGHYSIQVYAIALNDGLLGILILLGIKKKYVYAWAGTWLMTVTFFKITSLI